jgi:hypothetical protein
MDEAGDRGARTERGEGVGASMGMVVEDEEEEGGVAAGVEVVPRGGENGKVRAAAVARREVAGRAAAESERLQGAMNATGRRRERLVVVAVVAGEGKRLLSPEEVSRTSPTRTEIVTAIKNGTGTKTLTEAVAVILGKARVRQRAETIARARETRMEGEGIEIGIGIEERGATGRSLAGRRRRGGPVPVPVLARGGTETTGASVHPRAAKKMRRVGREAKRQTEVTVEEGPRAKSREGELTTRYDQRSTCVKAGCCSVGSMILCYCCMRRN